MLYLDAHKTMIVTVSHFTHGWIQDCLNSLFVHCPEFRILVVDNNPSKDDNKKRAESYVKRTWYKKDYLERLEMCETERDWICNQKRITVLNTTHFMKHGKAIDIANLWASENGVDTLIHVEPDCVVYGRMWIDSLVAAIRKGYWLACGTIRSSGIMHLVPGAYNVKVAVNFSFCPLNMSNDIKEKAYQTIITPIYHPEWQKKKNRWDFAQKFFYECAKLGKSVYIPAWDFEHFKMGSRGNYHPVQKEFIDSYAK